MRGPGSVSGLSREVQRQGNGVILNGVKDLVATTMHQSNTRCFVPQQDTNGFTMY